MRAGKRHGRILKGFGGGPVPVAARRQTAAIIFSVGGALPSRRNAGGPGRARCPQRAAPEADGPLELSTPHPGAVRTRIPPRHGTEFDESKKKPQKMCR